MLRFLWRPLASLNLSLILIGALTLAAMAGGTLPQLRRLSPAQLDRFQNEWPVMWQVMDWTGLSAVFSSAWFYALCWLLAANLAAGTAQHLWRIGRWRQGRVAPSVRLAGEGPLPERVARHFASAGDGEAIVGHGILGLFGLPLFHIGILTIVVAGTLSASVQFSTRFEMGQGEVYSGGGASKGVAEGADFDIDPESGYAFRLDEAHVEVRDERIRELQAYFTIRERGQPPRQEQLLVNHPLRIVGQSLYLDKKFGYTAAFDRLLSDGTVRRLHIHFEVPRAEWGKNTPLKRRDMVALGDAPLFWHMSFTPGEAPRFALQVTRDGAVVYDGVLGPGEEADLGSYRIKFLGALPWIGLFMVADWAVRMVFVGYVVTLVGFLLHLLVLPRRLRLVRQGDRWELEGWAVRDDWRFEAEWGGGEALSKQGGSKSA